MKPNKITYKDAIKRVIRRIDQREDTKRIKSGDLIGIAGLRDVEAIEFRGTDPEGKLVFHSHFEGTIKAKPTSIYPVGEGFVKINTQLEQFDPLVGERYDLGNGVRGVYVKSDVIQNKSFWCFVSENENPGCTTIHHVPIERAEIDAFNRIDFNRLDYFSLPGYKGGEVKA
jgi:hypothetical protein